MCLPYIIYLHLYLRIQYFVYELRIKLEITDISRWICKAVCLYRLKELYYQYVSNSPTMNMKHATAETDRHAPLPMNMHIHTFSLAHYTMRAIVDYELIRACELGMAKGHMS